MAGVAIFMCCSPWVSKKPSCATGLWHSCFIFWISWFTHFLYVTDVYIVFLFAQTNALLSVIYIHNCLIRCEYNLLTCAVLVVVKMVVIVTVIMKMTRMNLTPHLCHIC